MTRLHALALCHCVAARRPLDAGQCRPTARKARSRSTPLALAGRHSSRRHRDEEWREPCHGSKQVEAGGSASSRAPRRCFAATGKWDGAVEGDANKAVSTPMPWSTSGPTIRARESLHGHHPARSHGQVTPATLSRPHQEARRTRARAEIYRPLGIVSYSACRRRRHHRLRRGAMGEEARLQEGYILNDQELYGKHRRCVRSEAKKIGLEVLATRGSTTSSRTRSRF